MPRKWIAVGLIAWGLAVPAGRILAQYPYQVMGAPPAGALAQYPGQGPIAPPAGAAPAGAAPAPAGVVQAPPGWPGVDPNCGMPAMPPPAPAAPACNQPVCFTPGCSDCIAPDCCCLIAWLDGEWLGWRIKNPHVPFSLVSTSTGTLLDEGNVQYRPLSGGRLDWGVWFSRDHVLGMDFTGFGLESATKRQDFNSDPRGNPPLNFLVHTPGAVQVVNITAPGVSIGEINVDSASRLWGGEASLVSNVWGPLTLLAGFRYIREEDTFNMATANSTLAAVPLRTFVTDHFSTHNSFYGGELGARFVYSWGPFWVGAQAKAAYGETHQFASAAGTTTTAMDATFPQTMATGRYVTPANAGSIGRNTDGFVPEGQVKIGYQLGRAVTVTAGYDFLYWNRIQRASDLFSGGAGQPLTPIERTFWAQGITAGLEFDY
jgi:hypothetical protein